MSGISSTAGYIRAKKNSGKHPGCNNPWLTREEKIATHRRKCGLWSRQGPNTGGPVCKTPDARSGATFSALSHVWPQTMFARCGTVCGRSCPCLANREPRNSRGPTRPRGDKRASFCVSRQNVAPDLASGVCHTKGPVSRAAGDRPPPRPQRNRWPQPIMTWKVMPPQKECSEERSDIAQVFMAVFWPHVAEKNAGWP
jgi:hypothetical protein